MVAREVAGDHEQRLKEPERRRRRGARLLEAGVAPAEVARRVAVSRQAAWRWEQLRQSGGLGALRRPKHFGQPRRLRALGWSVQRPTGQARQRDEQAIRTWKARRWPELEEPPRDKAE